MKIRFLTGAASGVVFIVIMLMVSVLVVIGMSSATQSDRGALAAQESLRRSQEMYYLDGVGVEFLAHFDAILLDAQRLTNEYIESGAYRHLTHPDFPVIKQTYIREGHRTAANEREFLDTVGQMLFFYYADRELAEIQAHYPGVVITAPSEYMDGFYNIHGLLAYITLTHPTAQDLHLSISLVVNSNTLRNEYEQGDANQARYRITSWRFWRVDS